ncbi:MAG: PAS domain-containing protein, partial [Chitinophagaceae bacterium]
MDQNTTFQNTPTAQFAENTDRLIFALQAAGVGTWEMRLDSNTISWDDTCMNLYGLVKENNLAYDEAIKLISPEDRARVQKAVINALEGRENGRYDIQYRVVRADNGKVHWVHFKGQVYFNDKSEATRFGGIGQDITILKAAEDKNQSTSDLLHTVFDSVTSGISSLECIRDEHGSIIDFEYRLVNRTTENTKRRTDLIGKRFSVIHPDYHSAAIFSDFVEVVTTGVPLQRDRHYTGDGFDNWYTTLTVKLGDGVLFTFRDVTEEVKEREKTDEVHAQFRSLVEEAPIATCLLSGPELTIEIANDLMLVYWGENKTILGKPFKETVAPSQGVAFLQALEEALAKRITTHIAEAPVTLSEEGGFRTGYFNCTFKPLKNAAGIVYGILHMAVEVTEQLLIRQKLEAGEARFRSMVQQAPVPMLVVRGEPIVFDTVNDAMLNLLGKNALILGKPVLEVIPELEKQPILEQIKSVYKSGEAFYGHEVPLQLYRDGKLETGYYSYSCVPLKEGTKTVGVLQVTVDVTPQVKSRMESEETEAKIRSIIKATPAAIGLFVGRDLIVELPNQTFIDIVGKGPGIVGKRLRDVMPELDSQPFLQVLDEVYTSGIPYHSSEAQVSIVQGGVMTHNFYSITYTPLFDPEGKVYAILDFAIDVTKEVMARKKLEESEARLRSVIAAAPAGIGLFMGRDLIVEMPNQTFIELAGKGPDIIGKPLGEVMPELKDQALLQILDDVYTSGTTFKSEGTQIEVVQQGVVTNNYYNVSFTPLMDAEGQVYAILDVSIDVTDAVKAQQRIEGAQSSLRGAIELAELGTWEIDLGSGILQYSDRLKQWFNIPPGEVITVERAYQAISERDRPAVKTAILHAITPGTEGIYDLVYTTDERIGEVRILHAQGKAFFNVNGEAYKISGTVQDVTQQRRLQLALEQKVQQRTEELNALNNRLAATNEDLENANSNLLRSNEELAQYAYVASHDLQEPLRKIRFFSNMLSLQETLADEGKPIVLKIERATERMSLLIHDLLEFSRLLKSDTLMRPVDLSEIAAAVLTDFELIIQEKGAKIHVGKLPVVEAVALQMNQLF